MHTYTSVHTAPAFSKKTKHKNLPQEALSEVKLLLALKPQSKCRVSPRNPHPLQACRRRAHAQARLGPRAGSAGDPSGFLEPCAVHLPTPPGRRLLAPNSRPAEDLRTVPREPCPPRGRPPLRGHRAGCRRPGAPPPGHPGNSPERRPGRGEPCCPRAPRPPLRLPR